MVPLPVRALKLHGAVMAIPLDVLVLGDALAPGFSYAVRVIGVMRMRDNGEEDDKLLAVRVSDPVFGDIQHLEALQRKHPTIVGCHREVV